MSVSGSERIQRMNVQAPILQLGRGSKTPAERTLIAFGVVLSVGLVLAFVFRGTLREVGLAPGTIVLLSVLLVPATTCGRDPFHPARLLAALLGLGFVIGPVVHTITGFYALPGGAERQRSDLDRAMWALAASAALAFAAMRVVLGEGWRCDVKPRSTEEVSRRSLQVGAIVALVGTAALGAYLASLGRNGLLLRHATVSYTAQSGEGRSAYLNLLAPLALGALLLFTAAGLERGSRRLFAVAAIAAITIGVLLALPGSRANVLYAFVPLFFLYFYYRRLPRVEFFIPLLGLVVVLLIYGASLRSAPSRSLFVDNPGKAIVANHPTLRDFESLFLVDITHTESFLGSMDAYPQARPFMTGESFVFGLTGPFGWKIARIIGLSPEPPAGVTLTANAYREDPSTFGSGLTATLPGELYANAGIPGLLVGFLAFGALVGWIRRQAIYSEAGGKIVLYAIALTTLFAVFADYSGQILRGGAMLAGAGLALLASGNALQSRRAAVVLIALECAAIACLVAVRLAGPTSAEVLQSMGPAYVVVFATVAYAGVYSYRVLTRTDQASQLSSNS
jgi:hypothetical protein